MDGFALLGGCQFIPRHGRGFSDSDIMSLFPSIGKTDHDVLYYLFTTVGVIEKLSVRGLQFRRKHHLSSNGLNGHCYTEQFTLNISRLVKNHFMSEKLFKLAKSV